MRHEHGSMRCYQNKSTTPEPSDLSWIQKLTWTRSLKKKQRMIIEQIYYGRNTPELLSEYLGMRKNNFKSQTMRKILKTRIVRENGGVYEISHEAIDETFVSSGGQAALHAYLERIGLETMEHDLDGQGANDRRSMEKIDAHLRGDIPLEELTRWEKDQATGIRLRAVSKRKSRDDGLLVSGREEATLAGGTDD